MERPCPLTPPRPRSSFFVLVFPGGETMVSPVEWAGVPFLPFDHHDGRMLRQPGLYGFVRRGPGDERVLLYIDHADCIASVAIPAHPLWGQALGLGMNELHVCVKA